MAREKEDGGGFGWGFFVGGLIGFVAGAYLASGPGRDQVENLRTRTIELSGTTDLGGKARAYAERARTVVKDPEHPVGKAVREGVAAARRRRQELEAESSTVADVTGNGQPEA
ncbi:MAG TPA: hypothetical protein VIP52_16645 [Candidatus Dormibacteraeota bacterium]|jgi:hypothetical protein